MNRTELAWAAGFLEAEGCFSATGATKVVTISQVDIEPLDIFYNTIQRGTLKGPYEKATTAVNRRPQWIWYAYGKNAKAVYRLIRPWLGEYREAQAMRALGRTTGLPARVRFERWPWAEKVAWCGGFFEGEGCFSRSSAGLTVRLANTDLDLLKRLYSTVRTGHIYGPYNNNGKKPQHVFTTSGFEKMQAILAMLWPWLSSRRRLTAMVLLDDYLTFHACGHRRTMDGPWRRQCPRCFRPGPRPGELTSLRRALGDSATDGRITRVHNTGQIYLRRAIRDGLGVAGGDVLEFQHAGRAVAAERCRDERGHGMPSSSVTARGFVTIPASVRRKAGLQPSDLVRLSLVGRRLVFEPARRKVAP